MRRAEPSVVHSPDLAGDAVSWALVVHGKVERRRTIPPPRGCAKHCVACLRGTRSPARITAAPAALRGQGREHAPPVRGDHSRTPPPVRYPGVQHRPRRFHRAAAPRARLPRHDTALRAGVRQQHAAARGCRSRVSRAVGPVTHVTHVTRLSGHDGSESPFSGGRRGGKNGGRGGDRRHATEKRGVCATLLQQGGS